MAFSLPPDSNQVLKCGCHCYGLCSLCLVCFNGACNSNTASEQRLSLHLSSIHRVFIYLRNTIQACVMCQRHRDKSTLLYETHGLYTDNFSAESCCQQLMFLEIAMYIKTHERRAMPASFQSSELNISMWRKWSNSLYAYQMLTFL